MVKIMEFTEKLDKRKKYRYNVLQIALIKYAGF